MSTQRLKEILELFSNKTETHFEKWPNKYTKSLIELIAIGLAKVTFSKGKLKATLSNNSKAIVKMAVDENASEIILFNNEADGNCYDAIHRKREDELRLVKREIYVIRKKNKYKPIFEDKNGRPYFPIDFYADNVCIIGYKGHPCYPQDTVFGFKMLVGNKFQFLTTETDELSKHFYNLTKLTKAGYNQWNVYFGNVKTSYDGKYYQGFAGWEETWITEAPKHWVNEHVFYMQELSSNSDCFSVGINTYLEPCPVYQFYLVEKSWNGENRYTHIGFAYGSNSKLNTYTLKDPYIWSEYKKYIDPSNDEYVYANNKQ